MIISISDGLGNQLYQYAAGYCAARKRGERLILDISHAVSNPIREYMLDQLNIDCTDTICISNRTALHKVYARVRLLKYHVIQEKLPVRTEEPDERLLNPKSVMPLRGEVFYKGYWQHLAYFDEYRDEIVRQFTPKNPMSDPAEALREKLLAEWKKPNGNITCGIHIRCGDISPCKAEYYRIAIERMRQEVANVKFLVFSNEPETADAILKSTGAEYRLIGSEGAFTDLEEFFLLSSCAHQILSRGSFSFWGAYLNQNPDKKVIAPDFGSMSSVYYPADWVTLGEW